MSDIDPKTKSYAGMSTIVPDRDTHARQADG